MVVTDYKADDTSSAPSIPFLHKISPMNKEPAIQIIIFTFASVACFFYIYYISYLGYIDYLVRHSILPANNSWMLYLGSGLLLIDIILSVLLPIGDRYSQVHEIEEKELEVLQNAEDLMKDMEFDSVVEEIENFIEKKEKLYLMDNDDLKKLLQIAKINKIFKEKYEFMIMLEKRGKNYEFLKEFEDFSQLFLFNKQEVLPEFLPKIQELEKRVQNIQF